MINTKLSESGTRRVENEHVDMHNTVSNEPAAHPLRSEMDLESVFEWFGLHLNPARRINLMYGLLHMCQPLELRFLGACLEDLARKDFHVLRDFDMDANGPTTDLMGQLGDAFDPVGWYKLLVYLSLLGSDNRDSAGTLYRAWSQIDPISLVQSTNSTDTDQTSHSSGASRQHSPPGGLVVGSEILESSGWFAGDAERTLELLALLYTMASLHPAFSFQHREVAKLKLLKVEQEMERRRNIRHLKRMSSGERQNQTVQKTDGLVSSPGAEQRGRSPQAQQTHTLLTTSPQGRDGEAVAIDRLLLKRVTWNRPNWEYTIEAQWSDSSHTTVTKTHHQLESFLSELPYVNSSQFFQQQLFSLLQRADQYEPRELENKLRELLLTAPSPFRQREQICSYFLPHSQSKRMAQAPGQPQLNGLVERTSGAETLSSNPNPQMTAEERWAHSLVWRGRGKDLEGPKKERHQVRSSDGFGAPSGLQRKLQESLAVEEEEEEEIRCALYTSNLVIPPFGAAILQATPTHTPGPMPNPTAPLMPSPALSPIHTPTSSLTTRPLLSPGLTPTLSPQYEFDLSQSQRNLEQTSYHIGSPTSSTIRSPLSSHDSSPSAPLSSQVLMSSLQPCSPVCSPASSSSSPSPRGSMSSPVRKQSPQPNINMCSPVPILSPQSFSPIRSPMLSPQSCSPIRSPISNYSPQRPSPVSSPDHISRPQSSSFAPSSVSISYPQPRTPSPRLASKSSPQLTTPAQSPASIFSIGPSTPMKSPVFISSPEPSPISSSQTGLQSLVSSEKYGLFSSAAEGNGPFFRHFMTEDQSQSHVEVLEKQNPEEFLSRQNQNYSEPLSQKHVQAQSQPQNQTQDHNEVLIQSQLQSQAQTQSLAQSQAQEVLPQEHMIQTRLLSQDHTYIKTQDHNDGEAEVQLDPTQPMPVSVTSETRSQSGLSDTELQVQQNLIQALPCPGQDQPHSLSDQVFQVQQNPIHSLPCSVMAGQTQNVSIAEFQTQQNWIRSTICTVTTVQSQSGHTDQVHQVHLSPIHSVSTGQLPSLYPHGPGSVLAPTSVVASAPVLVSTSSFSQAPIFTHATSLGQATVLASSFSQAPIFTHATSLGQATVLASSFSQAPIFTHATSLGQATILASSFGQAPIFTHATSLGQATVLASSLSQATILVPTSSLDQANAFAPTSAPILASMSSLCQAVVQAQSLAPVPTIGLSPGLERSPDPSPNPAPAQAAASSFAPVLATYQTLLAQSHPSYSLQPMASFSSLYAPLYSSLGLRPGGGLGQSSGAGVKKDAGGTVSCYNCGHSGHSAEDCKEPSKDPAQQGVFQLKYSEAYDNTD